MEEKAVLRGITYAFRKWKTTSRSDGSCPGEGGAEGPIGTGIPGEQSNTF